MPEHRDAAFAHSARADAGFVLLQVHGAIASANDWITRWLGVPLPAPGRLNESGTSAVLWLAPKEWLLILPVAEVTRAVPTSPDHGKQGALLAATDLSDAFVHFELNDARAPDLLSSGSSFDFRPSAFGPGQAVRTLFAGIPVIVWSKQRAIEEERPHAAPCLQLLVDRSFADWLRSWIEESDGAW